MTVQVMEVFLPEGAGPCAKAEVIATLTTKDGQSFQSSNFCLSPQKSCPRDEQGYESGDGYHLCDEVCEQPAHAEMNVIRFARLKGATVRGSNIDVAYHWVCDGCKAGAEKYGITVNVVGTRKGDNK